MSTVPGPPLDVTVKLLAVAVAERGVGGAGEPRRARAAADRGDEDAAGECRVERQEVRAARAGRGR